MKQLALLTALLVTLLLQSCSNKPAQPLRLGAMASMDYLPFVIAQKQGIYKTLGLEVEIIKFFSANDRDAAFQSGNIDGTVIDYTGAALQHAGGIPLQIIMKNDGNFHLIAGKESGITTIHDLKNKNISVSRNTVIEYTTDQILAQAGIDPQETSKPEINKIPIRLEMLQSGQIDASVFPDPFASIAINNGHKSIITTRDLNISVTGTIFSTKALDDKSKEIQLLLKGYDQAVEYIQKHPRTDWIRILIEDAGVPEALAPTITLPEYKPAAPPAPEDIARTITWLKAKKLVPETYTGQGLVK